MLLRRFALPVCLVLASLVLWCFATERWSLEAWSTPMQTNGDPLEIYARVQAAAEDLAQPLSGFSTLPRLAAPFGADWSRYPVSDRVVFTGLGWLARGLGVFAAVNLAMALVHVLNALAFYVTARFLRWRHEWAAAIALLFAYCCYNFYWSVSVSFSLTFVVPPLLLLCGWIARPAPAVRPRAWHGLALALGLWFGGANPYLAFFACQLAGWSVVLQGLRRRNSARWRAGAIFIVAACVSFLLHNAPYFLASASGESRLTLDRNYAGTEIYALKLTDLVVPPAGHVLPALGEIGRLHQTQSALRTEFFLNYLGVFGLIGLALLAGAAVFAVARPRPGRRVPDAALGVAWTLAFSAVGGINSLLGLAGLDVFRASNRNSIFLLVWALFFFGRWVQRRAFSRRRGWRFALPLAVALVGILDYVPRMEAGKWLRHSAAELRTMREFTTLLERQLPPRAMIFQLPATAFPEAGVVGRMTDYQHVLPYLVSSTLRFSYGALRGTDAARCHAALGRLAPGALLAELEAAGFNALWLDHRGLGPATAPLITAFRALGKPELNLSTLPEITVFFLQPNARPRLPDPRDFRFQPAWSPATDSPDVSLVALGGWYDLEQNDTGAWRWARHTASTGLTTSAAAKVDLRFTAYSLTRGELVLTVAGREIHRSPIGPNTRDLRHLSISLPSGQHTIEWQFTGRLRRPGQGDRRELGFIVQNLTASAQPE